MSARAEDLLGPLARSLLARIEFRLALRTLAGSGLVALSALLLLAELAAAGSIFRPAWPAAAAGAISVALPALAILAAAGVLLPLLRRPGRIYLASLAEKARPELAGSLVTLAEAGAGRAALPAGAAELLSERAEAVLAAAPLSAGEVVRAGGAGHVPALCLAAAVGLGGLLFVVGGQPYLQALGNVAAGRGAPARTARARPPRAGASAAAASAQPAASVQRVIYRYPDYAGQPPRESDSAEIDCLAGATAEMIIAVRGEVAGVELRLEPGGSVAAQRAGDGLWRALVPVKRVGAYVGLVRRPDGKGTLEAFRGTITARADLPPSASARARELADGRLAVDYRLADDYRLGPARMTFSVGGRRMIYEVPDVPGRREAQGAVLVPSEVLAAAAGAGGAFRYRLEASDTLTPEPNRTVSPELEYRKQTRLAAAGPLLEPGRARPPGMAGSHGGGSSDPGPPSGGGAAGARPLQSLFKPEDDEGGGRPPPSGGGAPKGDDPYMAPSSGGGDEREPPPTKGKPGGEKSGEGEPGKPPGAAPGEGRTEAPQPGAGGAGNAGGDSVNTPGRPSGGGEGGSGGGEGGGGRRGEKPPTGNETGVSTPRPEQVLHEKVGMDFKPGESRQPGAVPPPLHTGYGTERRTGSSPRSIPGSSERQAPDGSIRTGTPGQGETVNAGSAAEKAPPVPPQYRRYVEEYLNSLSAKE